MRDGGAWEVSPVPWWRRRKARAAVLVPVALLAVRLGWGWHAARARDAELAAARGRGETASVADVRLPEVEDAHNAWEHQVLAMQAARTGVDSPASSSLEYPDYPPYPPAWTRMAAASEAAHGGAFARARDARAFPVARLRRSVQPPMFNAISPGLNNARHLANTVGDGALYAHVNLGDDAEAVERLRDVLHLARSLRQDPTVIAQLVGIGIDALACNRAMVVAPGVRVAGTAGAGGAKRPATAAQIRGLIRELLDEDAAWEQFGRALQSERVEINHDLATRGGENWVIRPLADLWSARLGRDLGVAVEASRLRTRPEAAAVLARVPVVTGELAGGWSISSWVGDGRATAPRYSRWFLAGGGGMRYDRAFETQFRGMGDRRTTAVSWAANWFRAERGRWPASLAELVPDYLPRVPADPFHADGRPVGYEVVKGGLPDGGDRPLVYYDAGLGLLEAVPREPAYGFYLGSRAAKGKPVRQFRDLSRFVPPPKPAAEE
jgi:hypothetical protein